MPRLWARIIRKPRIERQATCDCRYEDVEEALTYIFECEYASGRDVIEELDGVEYGLGIACLRKSCKSAL